VFFLNYPDRVRAFLSYGGDALLKERALLLSRIVLGNGVTSDGAHDRQQRRLLLPARTGSRLLLSSTSPVLIGRAGSAIEKDQIPSMTTLSVSLGRMAAPAFDGSGM